jgi:hypothetical protein
MVRLDRDFIVITILLTPFLLIVIVIGVILASFVPIPFLIIWALPNRTRRCSVGSGMRGRDKGLRLFGPCPIGRVHSPGGC